MAANHLGIILSGFVLDLHARGYTPGGIRLHVLVVEHFWSLVKVPAGSTLPLEHAARAGVSTLALAALPLSTPRAEGSAGLSGGATPVRGVLTGPEVDQGIGCSNFSAKPGGSTHRRVRPAHGPSLRFVNGDSSASTALRPPVFWDGGLGRGQPQMEQLQAKQVSSYVFLRARRLGPTGIRALVVNLRNFLRFLEFSGRLRRDWPRRCRSRCHRFLRHRQKH